MTDEVDPLLQAAYDYLGSRHVTLWGDFDISAESGRWRAARWLVLEMERVLGFLSQDHRVFDEDGAMPVAVIRTTADRRFSERPA